MSVARHTAYNLVGALVPLAVSIVTVPLYLKVIGVERYGVLAIFWTLMSSLGFLTLGMGPAVAQRLAVMNEAPANDRSQLVWTALFLSMTAALGGALLVLLLGQVYFARFASTPIGLQSEIRDAIPWLALGFPLILLSSVFIGALQARQRFGIISLTTVTTSALMLLAPLAVAYQVSVQLRDLILATICVSFASLVVQYITCATVVPLQRPKRPSVAFLKRLGSYGGWVTITSIVGPLLVYWDRFAIGALLGSAAVAIYVIPFNFVWQILILPVALASAIFPKLASAELAESRRLSSQALAVLGIVMTPMTLLVLFAAPPFLNLWLGSSLGQESAPVACILLFGLWTNSFARIPNAHIQARGRPDIVAYLLLAQALPYLVVLYFCVRWFGLLGAAMAWSLRCLVDTIGQFVLDKYPVRELTPFALQAALVVVAVVLSISIPPWALARLFVGILAAGAGIWIVWRRRPAQVDQLVVQLQSLLPWLKTIKGIGRNG